MLHPHSSNGNEELHASICSSYCTHIRIEPLRTAEPDSHGPSCTAERFPHRPTPALALRVAAPARVIAADPSGCIRPVAKKSTHIAFFRLPSRSNSDTVNAVELQRGELDAHSGESNAALS